MTVCPHVFACTCGGVHVCLCAHVFACTCLCVHVSKCARVCAKARVFSPLQTHIFAASLPALWTQGRGSGVQEWLFTPKRCRVVRKIPAEPFLNYIQASLLASAAKMFFFSPFYHLISYAVILTLISETHSFWEPGAWAQITVAQLLGKGGALKQS